jgi:hypothetical protein
MFLGKRLEDGRSARKKNCECSRMYPTNRTKTLFVGRLVTAFEIDGEHRGFHAGDFEWTVTAGLKVAGRMSGVTNVGTHREPPLKPGLLFARLSPSKKRNLNTVSSRDYEFLFYMFHGFQYECHSFLLAAKLHTVCGSSGISRPE